MDENIQSFFDSKNIAIVGVSHSRKSFGNAIVETLHERGFRIFPIHPNGGEIEGIPCLKSFDQLPPEVKSLVVCVSPKIAPEIVGSARNAGIEKIWFQQGANFKAVAENSRETGMKVVSRKCVLMYAPPVTGLHSMHRFFVRLLGKL